MSAMSQSQSVTRGDLDQHVGEHVHVRFKYGSMSGTLSEFRGVYGFKYTQPEGESDTVPVAPAPGETFAEITFVVGDVEYVTHRRAPLASSIFLK